MNSFFSMIYASVKKIINFSTAKVILLCSSGYLNEELLKYMDDESLKSDHVIQVFVCALHVWPRPCAEGGNALQE